MTITFPIEMVIDHDALRWPQDTIYMRHVMFRLMSILLERAEVAIERGELDLAMSHIEESLGDWHIELIQKGRYLAGQIEERRQNPESALDWYAQVLEDEKFGGEVVQLARNRTDELRAQGIH